MIMIIMAILSGILSSQILTYTFLIRGFKVITDAPTVTRVVTRID